MVISPPKNVEVKTRCGGVRTESSDGWRYDVAWTDEQTQARLVEFLCHANYVQTTEGSRDTSPLNPASPSLIQLLTWVSTPCINLSVAQGSLSGASLPIFLATAACCRGRNRAGSHSPGFRVPYKPTKTRKHEFLQI